MKTLTWDLYPPSPPAADRTSGSSSDQVWTFSPSLDHVVEGLVPSSVWTPQPHIPAPSPAAFVGTAQKKQGLVPLLCLGTFQGSTSASPSPWRTLPLGEYTTCVGLTLAPALTLFFWGQLTFAAPLQVALDSRNPSPPAVPPDPDGTDPRWVPSAATTASLTVGCLHPVSTSSLGLLWTPEWLRKGLT